MSDKIAFIVASTVDREPYLERCIRCFKESRYFGKCDFYLYYQGGNIHEVDGIDVFTDIVISPVLRGIFTPRYELFKRYGLAYDYIIMLDDDLFIRPDTDYYKAIDFCKKIRNVGCITVAKAKPDGKTIKRISYPDYTLIDTNGGMVFPRESVEIILDYFKDKEKDYSEDMFWLLLYIKGKDLYNDKRSMAIHVCNRPGKSGAITGYRKMRAEKPYVPIMSEWFYDSKLIKKDYISKDKMVRDTKSLKYIKPEGLEERLRNCGYY